MHRSTMGNVVQCCPTFLNYFKCSDALVQAKPERSPLLSSEESECDLPSLPEVTEEDLSPGSSNLTLEPENFLFPDIILSSNLGGDLTLVEPMVCLLVSEEENGTRVGEPGKEARGRSRQGRYEFEAQTEVEMHIGLEVKTQTEFQGHSEVLMHHNPAVEREVEEVETDAQQHTQPKLNAKVTVFTENNTDFMQQQNSNFTCAGPSVAMETDERESNAENFKFAGTVDGRLGQKIVQTRSKHLSERQTADQIKGSGNLHQSKKTGVNNRTGLFELEDGAGMRSMALVSLDRLFLTGQRHKSKVDLFVFAVVMQWWTGDLSSRRNRKRTDHFTFIHVIFALPSPFFVLSSAPLSDTEESRNDSLHQCVDQSIHDLSDPPNSTFNVRIQPPAVESFELQVGMCNIWTQSYIYTQSCKEMPSPLCDQVSGQMLVGELHQVLMEHEITCHRTCFSLRLGDVPLDSHTKLCSIQDGALIKVEEGKCLTLFHTFFHPSCWRLLLTASDTSFMMCH